MSASSKKKLRKEQATAKLTERQLAEQKEAKQLRVYTTAFVVVLAALLVIAIFIGASQFVKTSGMMEKNTVAVTVGDHQISNAELSYFYVDYVNNFYSNYGSYITMMGLDTTLPLNQQVTNQETGGTWADDFLAAAKENARTVYALADAAEEAGFTLTDEEKLNVEYAVHNIEAYATMYGFENGDAYLKAMYGNGASTESYLEYSLLTALADAYYANYAQTLTYEDADYREAEAENYAQYSSYSFNSYYVSTASFLTGGTTDEEGFVTYSDEERAAAVAAAEEAAKSIVADEIINVEAFDLAISTAVADASSTEYTNMLYSNVNSAFVDWVSDPARVEGDKTYVANTSTADGVETVNGYYVIYFHSANDNTMNLVNVRHILVGFEGGVTDETGVTFYTDEEKAAAKETAEQILADWEAGEATEDTFAALANEKSTDPGSNTNGGLYENIYPGQMVPTFEDWCFDASRKYGDTGIVETDYGYHIMYYVGEGEMTYRDYQIDSQLRSADLNEWYVALVDAMTVTDGDTKYMAMDMVLGN